MKRANIFYWVFTGLLIPGLGYGSIMELMGNPQSIEVITSLGYPAYLSPFLGVARILALVAIFTPKFPRLKEWAYAGLVFDVIGAIYSQIAIGNPLSYAIFPIIILGVIFGSYYFHHKRMAVKM
jgi:hypothetical protein